MKTETPTSEALLPCMCLHAHVSPKPTPALGPVHIPPISPAAPVSALSQLQTLPAWPSMSNSNLLVGTTLPFVLPIHRMCPLATPKLWNWHCLGIEVMCWALSVSPSSPASPHAALTPGLQAVLPGTKNTLISALSSLLKLSPPCLDSSTTLTCTGPGPAGPLPFQGSSWLPHHPLASLPPQCPLSNLDRTSKSTLSPQESL